MSKFNKITEFTKHGENPFVNDLLEMEISNRRKLVVGKEPNMVVNQSGEVVGSQVFAIMEKVDKEKFTKLYQRGIVEMFNLSKAGLKVFGYITTIAKPNNAKIIFDIDECKDFTNYKSDKPIFKGLAELIGNKFIARTKRHYMYYINPTMFFNGDRVAFIKMYVKSDSKELDI
ncbi:MAG: RepA protein [Polaribacter sp.]